MGGAQATRVSRVTRELVGTGGTHRDAVLPRLLALAAPASCVSTLTGRRLGRRWGPLGLLLLASSVHHAVPFRLGDGHADRILQLLLRALRLHAAGCGLLLLVADPVALVPHCLLARLLGGRLAGILLLPRQHLLDMTVARPVRVGLL